MYFLYFFLTTLLIVTTQNVRCFAISYDVIENGSEQADDNKAEIDLQNLALLNRLDIENLNNKLSYFGLTQLDPVLTQEKLNHYRQSVGQILQVVRFSKYLVPNVYEHVSEILDEPLRRIVDFLEKNDIRNVNCLIDNLSTGLINALVVVKNQTEIERTKRSVRSTSLEEIGLTTLTNNIKIVLKNSFITLIHSLQRQITLFVENVNNSLLMWSPSPFVHDITGIFRYTLYELVDLISSSLDDSKSQINDIFETDGFPSYYDIFNVFDYTITDISNKLGEFLNSRFTIVKLYFDF